MSFRVLSLQLTCLTDVHLLTCEAQVSRSHKWAAVADRAYHVWMRDDWLILCIFLLDRYWDLLSDLRRNHLDEELLMLSVHAASAFAATAWIWSTLLSLSTIASEARDRLRID